MLAVRDVVLDDHLAAFELARVRPVVTLSVSTRSGLGNENREIRTIGQVEENRLSRGSLNFRCDPPLHA
jgi:hypothetical protein